MPCRNAGSTPDANELTVHLLAAIGQHEQKVISKRTLDALAADKVAGMAAGGRVKRPSSGWTARRMTRRFWPFAEPRSNRKVRVGFRTFASSAAGRRRAGL